MRLGYGLAASRVSETPRNDAELVELIYRCLPDKGAVEKVLATNPARLHRESETST
jgi:hypothetical protein